ncbi:LysR family transcriptional regulator (plasmid) [Cupriavidus sp. P-10]|uniref:LysR family transcriptional regulator n=1 Tax=Cupriavidus sp. P-10 TaxID=2027911 RepID=UPI000E2F4772|nr:LysR family transcriptional regulator [Cupriavidus sp. P-10]BDB29775.1 LysR family transcriptional regulator [Cupriavidus sp. P-10]
MDRYSELVAFLQSARSRSFSAAARNLDLTPSAVSKLVARLETRLGVRLFVRQGRTVALTEEGQRYLPSAERVVEAMADAEAHGEALGEALHGRIRIHTMLTFARHQIVPWLPQFLQAHPGLSVEFHIAPQYEDAFDKGVDIAIHSGALPSSSRVARKIASSRWIVCAAPAYLARHGTPETPDDLQQHTCVGFSFVSEWNVWPFRAMDGTTYGVRPASVVDTTQGEIARDLALGGFGIVRLAEFHIGVDLRAGRLVPVLESYQDPAKEPLYLVYPNRKHLSPRVKVFCDTLTERMAAQPWAR